ncbi:MAG: GSCFA domain-containing protein [Saprospiraceae bacterium]|jgi:hypothetical protein|nr:GSCFA domain-containing protein [Saprospiraceae bacterium]MBL0026457.1 GSCFA domain-containing protein [Saprospiraceae bacterium]
MTFRTELSITKSANKLHYDDDIMTLGSCFSQHIGDRLQKYKFKCISNPFGTVFNPVSIANLIHIVCSDIVVTNEELEKSQGMWVHRDFHSSLSDIAIDVACDKINSKIKEVRNHLSTIKYLFVTLGTSIAYCHNTDDHIVANCHKLPLSNFRKTNIDVNAGSDALLSAINMLTARNPQIHIILTVSPVRHIRDGLIENSFSKSRLLGMTEMLIKNSTHISYFPSYEWMMDDLRDYRYYDPDMIHPNSVAIDYIWSKFEHHYFTDHVKQLINKIDSIILAAAHRPLSPSSDEHIRFCKNQLNEIQKLQGEYPYLNFDEEVNKFNKMI